MRLLFVLILAVLPLLTAENVWGQEESAFKVARLKYRGGGDWYNNPSALTNVLEYTSENVPITVDTDYDDVDVGSRELHNYPFAFMTGHGTVKINEAEASNLRSYLENGGFIYVDDDYGMDEYVRRMIGKVFPDESLKELPFEHPIYHQVYNFDDGLPKIHKHDGEAPRGFGIIRDGRLVLYYSYETNISDGWANPEVHNDPEEIRQQALKMGTNILVYALVSER